MAITKKALQEYVDKLLPGMYAQVFATSYPNCLVTHIEVSTSAYLDINESLSHMPDRAIVALEGIKTLVECSIATIRENS